MLERMRMWTVAVLLLAAPAAAQDAASLKSAIEAIHKANAAGDAATAGKLTGDVLPDEARLKKGVKDGIDAATFLAIAQMHQQMTPPADRLATILQPTPKHTVVKVYPATTEEIAAYAKGSVAYNEFPGGAQKVADKVLRPKTTYHEVAVLEPGKEKGMKFHLFYWDGARWTMLGPVWRAVK